MTGPRNAGHRIYNPIVADGGRMLNGDVHGTYNAGDVHNYTSHGDSLRHIPVAEQASFDAYDRQDEPLCLANTRVEVLGEIRAWAYDTSDQRRIFCNEGRLAASFFFSRGGGDAANAKLFFTTIAKQLATTQELQVDGKHALQDEIRKAMLDSTDIASKSRQEQWKRLIYLPLSQLRLILPMLVVIDALDECQKESDVKAILHILTGDVGLSTLPLRVFITSRPEASIQFGFQEMPAIIYRHLPLQDRQKDTIKSDITLYFCRAFPKIRAVHGGLPNDWPGNEDISNLVHQAEGLFLYASTVCQFLAQDTRLSRRRLASVLEPRGRNTWHLTTIDSMYINVLRNSILADLRQADQTWLYERFRQIVGTIVVMRESLIVGSLACLVETDSVSVVEVLKRLRSVVSYSLGDESVVHLLHASFREFMLDPQRCVDHNFQINAPELHYKTFLGCLRVMSNGLRRDLCGFRHPGVRVLDVEPSRITDALPPHVQYACRYWVVHCRQGNGHLSDEHEISCFLKKHLLHWLEGLCWMGKIGDAIPMISDIEASIVHDIDLKAFCFDIKRFVLRSIEILQIAPLQLYNSALVFSPNNSLVRKMYSEDLPRWLSLLPVVEDNWDRCLQIFQGPNEITNSSGQIVTISPDCKLVASALDGRTLKVWDMTNGIEIATLHSDGSDVTALVFSWDSRWLASGWRHGTLVLWNVGEGTRSPLKVHSGPITDIEFSRDGKFLASTHISGIRIWDSSTGSLHSTLGGNFGKAKAAFSPDGRLLASSSGRTLIRLWNVATMTLQNTLDGHSDVKAIAFSPDGTLMASAMEDRTVRLWSLPGGDLFSTLSCDFEQVGDLLFSPNGSVLASVVHGNFRIWDPMAGVLLRDGIALTSSGFAFSPDSARFAASRGNTVELHDVEGLGKTTLLGDHSGVTSLTFSSDGKFLASTGHDHAVKLWDASTQHLCIMQQEPKQISFVDVSHDGKLALSTHADRLRLWDTATGAPYPEHLGGCFSAGFSPDNKLLAIARRWPERDIWVYDLVTGKCHSIMLDSNSCTGTICFSHNGGLIAARQGGFIRLWSVPTGESLQIMESWPISGSIAFLQDDKRLASSSVDGRIRLWDVATGFLQTVLESRLNAWSPCDALTFSLDGHWIASASEKIQLWEIHASALPQVFHIRRRVGRRISFSDDAKFLHTGDERISLIAGVRTSFDPASPLNVFGDWIEWQGKQVLWLPHAYRNSAPQRSTSASHSKVLVIGHINGRVTCMRWKDEELMSLFS